MSRFFRGVLPLLAVASLMGCASTSAREEDASAESPDPTAPIQNLAVAKTRIPVRVVEVTREDVTETLDLTGTARPWEEFQIAPEVSGRLSAIHAEEGQWVRRGELLAELDRDKRLIELESRQASLARYNVELEFARKRLARGRALLQKGAISEAEVDTLEQAVQVAETIVRTGEISIDSILEELEDTRILAPADSRVSRRHVSLGEMVNSSERLFTLILVDPLKVVTELPEPYLHRIRPGQKAQLVFEAVSDEVLTGTVHLIQAVANPQSGAFPTEIRLSNVRKRLQPGMVARVHLAGSTLRDALLIPLDALVDLDGRSFVYRVEKGIALKVPVRIERRVGWRAAVEGALEPGDRVVTGGNQNLTDDTPVEVVP